jgi:hypothetical protein
MGGTTDRLFAPYLLAGSTVSTALFDGELAAFTVVLHQWCPTECSPRIAIIGSAFASDNGKVKSIASPPFAAAQRAKAANRAGQAAKRAGCGAAGSRLIYSR